MDARISVGVGKISVFPSDSVLNGRGEAFSLSGKSMDKLRDESFNLLITTPNSEINDELEIASHFMDYCISSWSKEQAEAILLTLQGKNQKEIGDQLKIEQSAVSQRHANAGWPAIKKMLARYEKLMTSYFPRYQFEERRTQEKDISDADFVKK